MTINENQRMQESTWVGLYIFLDTFGACNDHELTRFFKSISLKTSLGYDDQHKQRAKARITMDGSTYL